MIFQTFNNDIDKSIAKIGLFNKSIWAMKQDFKHGNGLAFSIFGGQSVTTKDRQAILDFNTQLQNGVKPAKAWATTMANCSIAAQNQTRQCLKAKGSLTELANGLETATISAKAGQVALRGLAIAGNMLAMWGISVAIQTAVKWIDIFVHSAEYAEKAIKAATDSAKSFSDSIKDIKKETVDMGKSIDSIIDRYAKLSQGVNTFTNENISLPTEQYEEFLGLNKQLTELFPSLTRNYDENGNAILGLSGSVDSVTASIRSLVEQEKELARAQIRENLEQYFEGTDEADGAWKALEGIKQKLEEANEALTTLKNTYEGLINADTSTVVGQYHKNFAGKEQAKYIEYIKNNFGEDIAKAMEDAVSIHLGKGLNGQFADLVVDFSRLELTETQKEQISRSYDTFYSELLAKQKTAMSEFESQNSEFSNNAMLWLEDLTFYKDNDKYTQTAIQNLVRNIDWSNYDFKELDYEGVKRILQDSVLTPFQIACEDPNTKKSLDNALRGLFTMDTSDMSVGDIASQVDSYINTIATAIGEDSTELKIKFGFDDTDTLPLINNVTDKLQNEFVDRVGELRIDELQIAAGLEIPNATLLSWDELITKIKEVQNSTANENPISSTITSSIEQIATQLEPQFKKLGDAYQNIFTADGFTLDAVDNSMLEDLRKTFTEIEEEIGVTFDTTQLENFFAVLSNSNSTAEQTQEAFNNIATSYLYSTDVLESLNSTTVDSIAKQLESLGITNASQLATEALSAKEEYLAFSRREHTDEAGNLVSVTQDLANATADDINVLIAEQGALEGEGIALDETTQKMIAYWMQKQAANGQLSTVGDIQQLSALCEGLGVSSKALRNYIYFKKLASMTDVYDAASIERFSANAEKNMEQAQADIQSIYDKLGGAEINFAVPDTSKKSKSEKDTTKEFDWIEQAIKNVEKEVTKLDNIVNSAYSTFSQKNEALAKEIGKVNEEIQLQQQAYDEYMRKADSIGLSDDYKTLIHDGAINIENISDKNLQEKISEYQQWYEKAVDASDAISELSTKVKDLHVAGYELQADRLEELLDNEAITEKQYLSEMDKLYKQYYENQTDYAVQAHEAKLALLNREKEYLNSVANAATSLLDKEISKVQDNAKEQQKPYEDQIKAAEKQIDAYEDQIKLFEKQIDAHNKQIDAYNKEIDLINDRKKPLQDELDALEDKAREENLILSLQEKQYNLKKAENQKDKLVNYMPDTIVI